MAVCVKAKEEKLLRRFSFSLHPGSRHVYTVVSGVDDDSNGGGERQKGPRGGFFDWISSCWGWYLDMLLDCSAISAGFWFRGNRVSYSTDYDLKISRLFCLPQGHDISRDNNHWNGRIFVAE